jgi:hypothetical protein
LPLIDAQDVIALIYKGGPTAGAIQLRQQLEAYPPCRIISVSIAPASGVYTQLIAVVETI